MALSAGTRLGPCEILEPLGAGGMGEVYRARDPRLDREVAIKVPPEEVADDPDLLHRFEREAQAAGALNHPNIPVVYDTGTHEDAPYVVTEFLERDYESARQGLTEAPEVRTYSEEVVPRTLLEGRACRFMGQRERPRSAFEAARVFLEGWLEEEPEDWCAHRTLALVYAGLGRKSDAIREARTAVELLPVSKDAVSGPLPRLTLAQVYATLGEHDGAIEEVEYPLSIPVYFSVWELRLDPVWDPLRDHPRFRDLVGEKGQAQVSS